MIDRLYKAYCYWRTHGCLEFIRLVILTLKAGGKPIIPSPESSSPNCGSAVSDKVRDIVRAHFAWCSPLRVFPTPSAGNRRITIVTDSINSGSLYGGVGTAMIIAVLLAEATQARLRIVTRTERAQPANFDHVLTTYGINVSNDVEFAFLPYNNCSHELDYFEGECFITTSWWTTAATMASVPLTSIIYLLQEDERMFYPYGDELLRCSTVLKSLGIRFVVNSRLLYDHFVSEGFSNIVENGTCFEPAFPAEVFYPRTNKPGNKRTFMFYARPNNLRNLFYFGIDLLEEAITRNIIDLDIWDILLVGKDIPKIVFGDSYVPEVRENLAWANYAELIGTVDLGLSLMYTPHPSYPPLDLAASGAVVVTNRFANKLDFTAYSKNIVCGDLTRESMLEALVQGVQLALDEVTRQSNHQAGGLSRCWRTSTNEIIRTLVECR